MKMKCTSCGSTSWLEHRNSTLGLTLHSCARCAAPDWSEVAAMIRGDDGADTSDEQLQSPPLPATV